MPSFLYKYRCLCFNKSVLKWTFCQSCYSRKNPIAQKCKNGKEKRFIASNPELFWREPAPPSPPPPTTRPACPRQSCQATSRRGREPGGDLRNPFSSSLTLRINKLERLYLTNLNDNCDTGHSPPKWRTCLESKR